jgi:hypothetical protein
MDIIASILIVCALSCFAIIFSYFMARVCQHRCLGKVDAAVKASVDAAVKASVDAEVAAETPADASSKNKIPQVESCQDLVYIRYA